jgi:integrase
MASLTTDAHGGRRVQFIDTNSKRRSLRLGQIPLKNAEAALVHIEALVAAKAAGASPDPKTALWAKEISGALHERLARVGLLPPRQEASISVTKMFERYFAILAIKASTLRTYTTARKRIEDHFGADRPLTTITPEDAHAFKRAMKMAGYAQATISKSIKVARQLFRRGVKQKLVESNPFTEIPAGSQTNATRLRFIPRETIERVMAVCPDNEWRLLIALSRFGGLRCPSEHLVLRWEDVDWDRQRITIRSPKTEANENQETRVIPLFPELIPYLRQAQAEAPVGARYVMTERYRRTDGYGRTGLNLGTQFKRIIRQAGLEPWPRVWHNLRATRQTELAERFPLHVVCAWLGNTSTVAAQSYLIVRDEDFTSAREGEHSERVVQNAAQQGAEMHRSEPQHGPTQKRQVPDLQALATLCDAVQIPKMTPMGFEPMSHP